MERQFQCTAEVKQRIQTCIHIETPHPLSHSVGIKPRESWVRSYELLVVCFICQCFDLIAITAHRNSQVPPNLYPKKLDICI